MGFRSTMTTEHFCIKLPEWFMKKWRNDFLFGESVRYDQEKGFTSFPISSKSERKFYSSFPEVEIFLDIQKLVIEHDLSTLTVVLLHECGGITRVEIHKDKILAMEPTVWKPVEGIEHDYCYGCSDYKRVIQKNV